MVSQDRAIAFQPGQQEQNSISKKKRKEKKRGRWKGNMGRMLRRMVFGKEGIIMI